MDMDLKEFIEYAVNADLSKLPNDLAQEVAASIRYVSELHYSWLVTDPDDVAWWLDHEILGCTEHTKNVCIQNDMYSTVKLLKAYLSPNLT